MPVDSEEIKKEIVDQMYWDQSVDASKILVEVANGKVKLTGRVPSFSARRAAYNDAIVIPGVTSVDNQLNVETAPTTYTVSDDELKTRIENVLSWSASLNSANSITVAVSSGRVILSGYVGAYWKKLRAEELTSEVAGVREVENALSVVLTKKLSDKLIADDLMTALERRDSLEINQINVTVENGVVTLSGAVPDWTTLKGIERTACYTAGVSDVVNHLGVISPLPET